MLISIIVPVYNAQKFLKKCIDSLLAQDCSKFEIILINDGSSDESGSICDNFEKKNANVRVLHQTNKGPSSARNLGIKNAIGKYIAFVDSDDLVSKNYIEALFIYAKESNSDIIHFAYNKEKSGQTIKVSNNLSKLLIHKDICYLLNNTSSNNFLWYPWNKLYKKSLLKKHNILFDSNVKVGEDTLFNLRSFYYANSVFNIDSYLYTYVCNENSITQTPYKDYLNDNMQAHFENRMKFHEENIIGEKTKYYQDIAKYYIEHVFFLLLSNSLNKPNRVLVEELKEMRQLQLFSSLFKHYKSSKRITIKMKLLIYLFKFRQFSLMSKLL
ncbi:glycosyltransferase [uncultured Algibacter sp.]|uniref:glycosyltransferase n=1 Tax=uncultured Algibacter sp. TaxID=298659 RepID=UPI00262E6648|nr:glycosyltransferase [uncultured Algibacter sp.]